MLPHNSVRPFLRKKDILSEGKGNEKKICPSTLSGPCAIWPNVLEYILHLIMNHLWYYVFARRTHRGKRSFYTGMFTHLCDHSFRSNALNCESLKKTNAFIRKLLSRFRNDCILSELVFTEMRCPRRFAPSLFNVDYTWVSRGASW